MSVVSTDTTYNYTTSSTSSSTSTNSSLDKDAFMKMFLAQLQNQDPLNPMDATQVATQLAQFSMVEQMINLNTTATSLLEKQTGATNAQLLNVLGREAVVKGNTVYVSGDTVTQASFKLDKDAYCIAQIYDSDGNLIKAIEVGQQSADQTIVVDWDGTDTSGNKVADGTYTFSITASRTDGSDVTVTTYAGGLITGAKTDDDGNPQFTLNYDSTVNYSDVVEVRMPKTTEE
jgi:flagellar basal-body rod modification protein FlgD